MRSLQVANIAQNERMAQPVAPSQLLQLANEPARAELPPEARITRSARTVVFTADDREGKREFCLERSDLHEGMFELPACLQIPFGIPGRTGERLETTARMQEAIRNGTSKPVIATAWIPETEAITYHPIPVFSERATAMRPLKRIGAEAEACQPRQKFTQLDADEEPITIFGTDNRVNIYPSGYPERCVCRIEVYTQDVAGGMWIFRKRGTGFMAGDRIMMTSGHMAPPRPYAGWMIKVVPGYYDGRSVYGPSFLSYASDYRAWYSDAGNDLMVCRLYDPIGRTTGYFGATTYSGSWEDRAVWSMCGYPFDRGENRPTYQGSIPVRDDDDGDDIRLPNGKTYDTTQVENEADRAKGASGSPLYSWFDNGQMYAIGVHHGLEVDWIFLAGSEKYSAASGGAGLPALINWARETWS